MKVSQVVDAGNSRSQRAGILTAIKAVHSLVFLSMCSAILYTLYSGITNRISRLTKISIAMVMGEGLVYMANAGRCPLTDLVENLGAEHGSVSDIFLPAWFAERVPILFSPPFGVGLALLGACRLRSHPARAAGALVIAGLFMIVPFFGKTSGDGGPSRHGDQTR